MQLDRSTMSRARHWQASFRVLAALAVTCLALAAPPAPAQTLERIAESGRIRLGYLPDGAPFTRRTDDGAVEGYLATLCEQIAAHARMELALPDLRVEWVPVDFDDRLSPVQEGRVDLLCSPMAVTLQRRREVSFSLPVFGGGNRAVLRANAPSELRAVLTGVRPTRPVWRGKPAATVLQRQVFGVVGGTTTERWLADRLETFHVDAAVMTVPDYQTALQGLANGNIDVFFGERSVVVEAMHELGRPDFVVLDRLFTHEQLALALSRDDSDFRLLVDTALSRAYRSEAFAELYIQWFGDLDETAAAFIQWNTLPE